MPYSIQTKDGIVINNIPDDIPEDDPSLKAKVAEIRAQNQVSQAENQDTQKVERSGTTLARAPQMIARGMAAPTIGAIGGGLVGGPVGAVAGSLAVPAADLLASGYNMIAPENYQVGMPSTAIQRGLTNLGMPEPESTTERVLAATGAGVGGLSNLPALSKLATTATTQEGRGLAQTLSQQPVRQTAVAAPASAASQYTYEVTDNPYLAMLAGTGAGIAGGIGAGKSGQLTQEQLKQQSSNLFDIAKNSGVVLNNKPFQANMKNIASSLRSEGYTPTGDFPNVNAAIKELTTGRMPKDFVELQALRTMIKNGQASSNPNEQRIASMLVDKFDDYVMNIPARDLSKSSNSVDVEAGMQAWSDARNAYSRLKKAEIFEDIKDRAEMNATRYSQSGAENAIVADLRNLANNKKKMKFFTSEEQESIRKAVKGGKIQNVMRFLGKYAPTSPLASAGGAVVGSLLGATTGAGVGALAVPAVGTVARTAATKMRENQLAELTEIMRRGGQIPTTVSPAATLGLRGLISSQGQ
jgi:outer membrane lipoprotein SlyB